MRYKNFLKNSTLILAMTATPTFAQQAPSNEDSQIADNTIVVTATRRAQSVQDVGLSLTAIGSKDIEARGINDFFDYGSTIPNLSFGAVGDGALANRSVSIRGIQGNGTTGFYIDETPIEESIDPRIVDIERIEVLRGPQGTLFGARSMGGTVRIITKQPDFNGYSGRVRGRVSTTKEGGANYLVDGAVNIPLIEGRLAARVLGFYQYDEGVFDRAFGAITSGAGYPTNVPAATDVNENVDDQTAYGGQLSLLWQPTDRLSITPRVLYQKVELDGLPFAENDTDNFTQRAIFNNAEGGEDEYVLTTLTAKYDAGFGEFVAASSYFDRETFEFEDLSAFVLSFAGTPAFGGPFGLTEPIESTIFQTLGLESFVQEVRFVSDFDGPFQFTIGGFYSDREEIENFEPPALAPGLSPIFGSDLIFMSQTTSEVKEKAFFGEASYDLTNTLTVIAGIRVFDSEITFSDRQSGIVVGPTEAMTAGVQSEDGVNLKFSAEWKPNNDLLVYATAAEGFRLGGVNTPPPLATCGDDLEAAGIAAQSTQTFDSDSLWNYEIGAKSTILGGRVNANAAAFFIEWDDIQQTQLLGCGFSFQTNAGAAQSKGVELELSAQVTDGFDLGVNVGYNDAEITQGGTGLAFAVGDPVQQVPEWTVSANAAYEFQINNQIDGFMRGDIAYIGESFSATNDAANPRLREDYTILNFRSGIRAQTLNLTFFIDNLTNEIGNLGDSRSLAAEIPGRERLNVNRPRTIGLEVRKNF